MSDARYEVILTKAANNDLRAIHAYRAAVRSAEDADDLLDQLSERILALQDHPMRGAVPRELESSGTRDFRQLAHPPYRLIYSVQNAIVLVLMIADGRRDMDTLLKQRLLGN